MDNTVLEQAIENAVKEQRRTWDAWEGWRGPPEVRAAYIRANNTLRDLAADAIPYLWERYQLTRDALQRLGKHTGECTISYWARRGWCVEDHNHPCTCGLYAVIGDFRRGMRVTPPRLATSLIQKIIDLISADIGDRSGMGDEWLNLMPYERENIKAEWATLLQNIDLKHELRELQGRIQYG